MGGTAEELYDTLATDADIAAAKVAFDAAETAMNLSGTAVQAVQFLKAIKGKVGELDDLQEAIDFLVTYHTLRVDEKVVEEATLAAGQAAHDAARLVVAARYAADLIKAAEIDAAFDAAEDAAGA